MAGRIGVCASLSREEQPGVRGRSCLLALRPPLWIAGREVESLLSFERAVDLFGLFFLKVSIHLRRNKHGDCGETCLEGLLGLVSENGAVLGKDSN